MTWRPLLRRVYLPLSLALLLPLLIVWMNVYRTYAPGLEGHAPRNIGPFWFWIPLVVAISIFQAVPYATLMRRVVATIVFTVIAAAILWTAYFWGACLYGDCL